MKINLDALRKAGWHVSFDGDAYNELQLLPPTIHSHDYNRLREVLSSAVHGDYMAMELVLQQTLVALQKAALLAVIIPE